MKLSRVNEIIRSFEDQEILIVGDLGLDVYTLGEVSRISPEAPVPIVHVTEKQFKLGLAANVSDNVKALNGKPITIGVIGEDHAGKQLLSCFQDGKIEEKHICLDHKRPTITKERITTAQQQIVRVDYESLEPLSSSTLDQLCESIEKLSTNAKVCILQDYGKGLFSKESTKKIITILKKKNLFLCLDPNIKSDLSWFSGVDLVKPNSSESQALTHLKAKSNEEFEVVANEIKKQTQAKSVVITRGAQGMSIYPEKEKSFHLRAYAREVFDVSGAGDTVISVIGLALSSKTSLEEACFLANLTSGIEVGKRGTATVSPAEILEEAKFHLS